MLSMNIDRVTLVINADTGEEVQRFLKAVRSYKPFTHEVKVMVRPNIGFSYGGWASAVNACIENDEGFTHYFLIEDDYVPCEPNFIDVFNSKMIDGIGYVCQKLSHEGWKQLFGIQTHAGASCGLLLGEAAEKAYEKYGSALMAVDANEYNDALLQSQVHFLDFVTELGYGIADVADKSSAPFLHNYNELAGPNLKKYGTEEGKRRGWFIVKWGDPKMPSIIEPVISEACL